MDDGLLAAVVVGTSARHDWNKSRLRLTPSQLAASGHRNLGTNLVFEPGFANVTCPSRSHIVCGSGSMHVFHLHPDTNMTAFRDNRR